MKLYEMKKHFITYQNLMRQLGTSAHTYDLWMRKGYVPYKWQLKAEVLTCGELVADPLDDKDLVEGFEKEAKQYFIEKNTDARQKAIDRLKGMLKR